MLRPDSADATNTLIVSGVLRIGQWRGQEKSTAGRALAEQVQGGQEGKRKDGVLFEEVEGTVPFGQDFVLVIGLQVRDSRGTHVGHLDGEHAPCCRQLDEAAKVQMQEYRFGTWSVLLIE